MVSTRETPQPPASPQRVGCLRRYASSIPHASIHAPASGDLSRCCLFPHPASGTLAPRPRCGRGRYWLSSPLSRGNPTIAPTMTARPPSRASQPPSVVDGCETIAPSTEAAAPPTRNHHQVWPRPYGNDTAAAATMTIRQKIRKPVESRFSTTKNAAIAAATRPTCSASLDVKLDMTDRARGGGYVERQGTVLDRRGVDPEEDHRPLDRAVAGRRLRLWQHGVARNRAPELQREQALGRDGLERVPDGVDDAEV